MIIKLNEKKYDMINAVEGDEDVLECFFDYSGSIYVCDAISEIADSNVDIYNYDLWKNASSLQDWIERAIEEGLVDTRNFDLMRCFMAGHYEYNTELLYNNLENLIYNYAVKYINDKEIEIDEKGYDDFIENLENEIEIELSGVDNNNMLCEIENLVDNVLGEMIDGYEG